MQDGGGRGMCRCCYSSCICTLAEILCVVSFAIYCFLSRHVTTSFIYFQVLLHTQTVQTFDFSVLLLCSMFPVTSTSKRVLRKRYHTQIFS